MPLAAHRSHLVFAAALLLPFIATAQQVPTTQHPVTLPTGQPNTPAQTSDKPITIDAVAIDKSGTPIPALSQSDFTLLDNKNPRALTGFNPRVGKDLPVEVILVIDAVNTRYDNVAYERSEIDKFLHANEGQLPFPTTLAIFTDTGTQIQPGFSKDGNAISAALKQQTISLRTLRRSSGFYGAEDRLNLSLTALRQLMSVEAQHPGRKLIVWISPGWPYLSSPAVELDGKQQTGIFSEIVGLSTQLRQDRITLYSIDPIGPADSGFRTFYYRSFLKGVQKPGQVDLGDLSLQVLATQSGGLAISGNSDVAGALRRCISDANAFYELTFNPPPSEKPNEYHHLDLLVAKPGLTARTRDGYYLQP